jgi:hypothetical protein
VRADGGRARLWLALPFGLSIAAVASLSRAQRVASDHPLTVIVGTPAGVAVTERLDVARSNVSSVPLPSHSLRILWTRYARPMHQPPVVLADGTVVVVSDDGEALLVSPDGTDRGHVAMGPGPTSAPALLSDGTLVVVNATGDVVGARLDRIAFRAHVTGALGTSEQPEALSHIARSPAVRQLGHHLRRAPRPRPQRDPEPASRAWLLPLTDGGAVVAVDRELACIDATGAIRSRASATVAVASPLVATRAGVAFVGDNGEAYTWDLRTAPDAVSARGSFGGSVDGAVVALDDHSLLTVVPSGRLVSLDLVTGETSTRTRAAGGLGIFTGAFALEPAPRGTALLEEMTLAGTRVVAVDPDGQETPFATLLTTQGAQRALDAGVAVFLAPSHTMLFADPGGSVAYATVDGHVGVASPTSKVELGTLPCGSPPGPEGNPFRPNTRASAGFAGLVPAGPGAFVVACDSGRVSFVQGAVGE